jgi:hypothetical protein
MFIQTYRFDHPGSDLSIDRFQLNSSTSNQGLLQLETQLFHCKVGPSFEWEVRISVSPTYYFYEGFALKGCSQIVKPGSAAEDFLH